MIINLTVMEYGSRGHISIDFEEVCKSVGKKEKFFDEEKGKYRKADLYPKTKFKKLCKMIRKYADYNTEEDITAYFTYNYPGLLPIWEAVKC